MRYLLNALFLILLLPFPAYPAATCFNETIAELTMTGTAIYFKTDKTCTGTWCQIDPAWSDLAKEKAYATLLTAISQGKPVSLRWGEHASSCEDTLPVSGTTPASPWQLTLYD